jgi:hypothetical protein
VTATASLETKYNAKLDSTDQVWVDAKNQQIKVEIVGAKQVEEHMTGIDTLVEVYVVVPPPPPFFTDKTVAGIGTLRRGVRWCRRSFLGSRLGARCDGGAREHTSIPPLG